MMEQQRGGCGVDSPRVACPCCRLSLPLSLTKVPLRAPSACLQRCSTSLRCAAWWQRWVANLPQLPLSRHSPPPAPLPLPTHRCPPSPPAAACTCAAYGACLCRWLRMNLTRSSSKSSRVRILLFHRCQPVQPAHPAARPPHSSRRPQPPLPNPPSLTQPKRGHQCIPAGSSQAASPQLLLAPQMPEVGKEEMEEPEEAVTPKVGFGAM